jgi:hypothetical protein
MEKTIEQIKSELPNVKIEINKKIYNGQVFGRCNQFATVAAYENTKIYNRVFISSYEFSWAAIQRAVNNNSILLT